MRALLHSQWVSGYLILEIVSIIAFCLCHSTVEESTVQVWKRSDADDLVVGPGVLFQEHFDRPLHVQVRVGDVLPLDGLAFYWVTAVLVQVLEVGSARVAVPELVADRVVQQFLHQLRSTCVIGQTSSAGTFECSLPVSISASCATFSLSSCLVYWLSV